MFKRILALTLAVALVAALWIVPSMAAAPTLEESLAFNADYTKNSTNDQTGNFTFGRGADDFPIADHSGVLSITTDRTIGSLKYTGTEVSLGNTATYEAYFLSEETTGTHEFLSLGDVKLVYSQETGFGIGDVNQGSNHPGNSQYLGKWTHVVAVVNNGTATIYLNGEELISGALNAEIKGTRVDAGYDRDGSTEYNLAFARIYDGAATAEEVTALYNALSQTEEPSESPSEPTPVLPSGEDYEMTAEKIPAFQAGDQVTIKTNIKALNENGLVGFDLYFAYNSEKLEFDEEATMASWESSSVPSGWWLTAIATEEYGFPGIRIKMADDSGKGLKVNEEIYVEFVFTALADSAETGEMIAYTTLADGALNDASISVAHGTGMYVYAEAKEEPTESPSETPSESPSEQPTTKPGDPEQPPTFDAGIISLAAVALSSVVAVKKRKIS